jgi:hypothetical protein
MIQKNNCNKHSAYLFFILDDAASSELIVKNYASIIQLLNIWRYMLISCAICAQTVRDIIKECKRWIGDAFLYRNLTYNDLEEKVKVFPPSYDINEILLMYKSRKGKQGKLITNSLNDHIEIRDEWNGLSFFFVYFFLFFILTLFFIWSKMTAQEDTSKLTWNNETFTIGSYNGFSILTRNKDDYVNLRKRGHDIKDKESITRELRIYHQKFRFPSPWECIIDWKEICSIWADDITQPIPMSF